MMLIFALILTTFGSFFICWIDDKNSHLKRDLRDLHENCKFLIFKFSKATYLRCGG